MNATSREAVNPKTGLTLEQMKDFIRDHFEQFVNQKNLDIADVEFCRRNLSIMAPMCRPEPLQVPPERSNMWAEPINAFPTFVSRLRT